MIGFIGFGEAAFHIAKGLRATGAPSFYAFDIPHHRPFLRQHHLYADLNSVPPALKQGIGAEIATRPARYVEAAIMSLVPSHGKEARVRERLAAGELGLDIYGLREKLAQMGIVIPR